MKFTEILEELRKGKKVTREKWEECKTECYKYIKLEHGEIIAYLKDDNGEDKVEERTKCMFELADFTAEDWKIYKESNLWKPKNNEEFYYLCSDNNGIYSKTNGYSYNDKCKIDIGNCFKTKKEAQHMIQKIHIITQLRKLSNINFNDTSDEAHYAIAYDVEANEITFNVSYYYKDLPFNIYFVTKEDCQKAIETIGEENLKKYYFDIKDNQ